MNRRRRLWWWQQPHQLNENVDQCDAEMKRNKTINWNRTEVKCTMSDVVQCSRQAHQHHCRWWSHSYIVIRIHMRYNIRARLVNCLFALALCALDDKKKYDKHLNAVLKWNRLANRLIVRVVFSFVCRCRNKFACAEFRRSCVRSVRLYSVLFRFVYTSRSQWLSWDLWADSNGTAKEEDENE